MRRTRTPSRTSYRISVGLFLATLGAASLALAAPAGAQDGRDDTATTTQPVTSNDATPSCSLFPTRNGDGTTTFTNHNHERRYLQAFDVDGRMIYNAWLEVGASTGPLAVHNVIWSGHAYTLAAYNLIAWCTTDDEVTTTTTAPPPTTTSTVPLAPPTTVPVTTTAPPATVPPTTATTATEPPTLAPPTSEPPACLTIGENGVCGVEVTRSPELAVTGRGTTPGTLAGLALLATGVGCLAAAAYARRRPASA